MSETKTTLNKRSMTTARTQSQSEEEREGAEEGERGGGGTSKADCMRRAFQTNE